VTDDPGTISCYKVGDKVELEGQGSLELPLQARNCIKDTTFLLRHLDHFVEPGDFLQHADQIGVVNKTPGGELALQTRNEQATGISLAAAAVGTVAVSALAYGAYYYYYNSMKEEEKKSWWDRITSIGKPKPPTLMDRIQGGVNTTLDSIVRYSPFPENVTIGIIKNLAKPQTMSYNDTLNTYNQAVMKDVFKTMIFQCKFRYIDL
jgi:hypothetical protein